MLGKICEKYQTGFWVIFRVFIGFLFFLHGTQKVFGMFGGTMQPLTSLMGAAGIIELVAGIAITIGLFTRLAAFVSAIEMVVAYVMVHYPKGAVPITNGGELALLYFAAFLILVANGSGTWSVEKALFKKEFF